MSTQQPYVAVRATVRFMVYGQNPAQRQELELWVLKVPPEWIVGVSPGASSPALTQRCGGAVSAQYQREQREAFERAKATLAQGGEFDAGHYRMEGASIWLIHPDELERRPWKGAHRFLFVVDAAGEMRRGTEADEPQLRALSAFEESAFAGFRAEELQSWADSARAYEEARTRARAEFAGSYRDPSTSVSSQVDPTLLADVYAGLVRANAKMRRLEEAAELAAEAVSELDALGAPADRIAMVHVRMGEGQLEANNPAEAAEAYARAIPLFPDGDPRIFDLSMAVGLAHLRVGDFAAACAPLRTAVDGLARLPPERRRSFGEAQNNLALALEHEGQLEDAERYVRGAIETHGQSPGAEGKILDSRITLARILARRGATDEARSILAAAKPRVLPGSIADGLVSWACALVEDVTTGDTLSTLAYIQRAQELIAAEPAWKGWVDEDAARLMPS